jgi:excisionase family DNA binding protein
MYNKDKIMLNNNKEFYKTEELASLLQVNVMTIYRYIKAGKLKAYKLGRGFRIDKKDFDDFLNKMKVK